MKFKGIYFLMYLSFLFIRAGYKMIRLFLKIIYFLEGLWVGFWLGILKKRTLQKMNTLHYDKAVRYFSTKHNKEVFFDWEKNVIDHFFCECRSIMVIGAGGGREVYQLTQKGFDTDGFECNIKMVDFANRFFTSEKMHQKIMYVEPDEVPETVKKYDAVMVGWTAYTYIKCRRKRMDFLKNISATLNDQGLVFISFFRRKDLHLKPGLISKWGNFWTGIRHNESLEEGDSIYSQTYAHFFTENEIRNELLESGFEVLHYDEKEYGNALGKKIIS